MKFQSNNTGNLLYPVTDNEIKNLTTQVKETIALEFTEKRKRIFSLAEMWNIQRMKKNISGRKMYF